jgi:hypothetical protein
MVTGQVASYSVNPALPAGLNLNATTGVISGTPTAVAIATTYTVTATNAGGSTTATLSITVNSAAATISYASSYYAFTVNVPVQTLIKSIQNSPVSSWSINPALPAGLALGANDGIISGTPTVAAAPATYVVTATSTGGQSTFNLTIGVAAAPLLDLGHADSVDMMRSDGSRVLSIDSGGHWALQDYTAGTMLASGTSLYGTNMAAFQYSPPIDLAGGTVIIVVSGGVESRSSTDGHLVATIPGQYTWYRLATDGSYICAGNATSLAAWTTSGQMLLSRSGDYSKAIGFAAAGAIKVALGAAGQSVIETVSVPTGTSVMSPTFQGQFNSWFQDGTRFLTNQGNVVFTYSSAGTQQDLTQLSSISHLTGQGSWFWNFSGGGLSVYQVGASSAPAYTVPLGANTSSAVPSGNTIGILSANTGQITVVDLSGATPVSTTSTAPIVALSSYAASSSTAWVVGNGHGVILDGGSLSSQPRYLTLGRAWSIAGGTAYVSVATASGKILSFDSSTGALANTLNFSSSLLSTSSSGTLLAAMANSTDAQYEDERTLNVYSLPSGSVISTFPFSFSTPPTLFDMSLSGSGTVLAEQIGGSSCRSEVLPVTGGTPILCDTKGTLSTLNLSPDGTLVAAATGDLQPGVSTNIYKNGTLVSAVPGWVVGWIDNARFLAITYSNTGIPGNVYNGSIVYDSQGNVLSTQMLPEMHSIQTATANSVYSPTLNKIVSLDNGTSTWASGNAPRDGGIGAITPSQVVFASGNLVLAQPH